MLHKFLTLSIMFIISNDNLAYLLTNFPSTDKIKFLKQLIDL